MSDCWFQGKLLEGENFKNRNIASYGCDSFFDTCKFDFRENFWRAKRNLAQGFFSAAQGNKNFFQKGGRKFLD